MHASLLAYLFKMEFFTNQNIVRYSIDIILISIKAGSILLALLIYFVYPFCQSTLSSNKEKKIDVFFEFLKENKKLHTD